MSKRVFVSGCFDLLHSGHVAFFQEAAQYGDLTVALGSDKTLYELKNRVPVNNEQERLFMVKAVGCVHDAFVSSGSGKLDFAAELEQRKPDLFIVNEDGDSEDKRDLCRRLGVDYKVLKRVPHTNLPTRSTTSLRSAPRMPYRIDLAGGWLDQPFVSKHHPGPVLTVSLEPTVDFNTRSGMATSTRNRALELWGPSLPLGDPHKIAKALFCYDNPPGTQEVSGSQDAIGLVFPGLAKAHYEGDYWPTSIDTVSDEDTLHFVERSLQLIPLTPRGDSYSVLSDTNITATGAKALAEAAEACWQAILAHDVKAFGESFRASYEAQVTMFPNMVTEDMRALIETYRDQVYGWKVSGAGGGGYLILVTDKPIDYAVDVSVRRAFD